MALHYRTYDRNSKYYETTDSSFSQTSSDDEDMLTQEEKNLETMVTDRNKSSSSKSRRWFSSSTSSSSEARERLQRRCRKKGKKKKSVNSAIKSLDMNNEESSSNSGCLEADVGSKNADISVSSTDSTSSDGIRFKRKRLRRRRRAKLTERNKSSSSRSRRWFSSSTTSSSEARERLQRRCRKKAMVHSVRDFYKCRSVLVTGGTGFMGKVLIEQLLFHVPDIQNIYVLIRPKRGKSVQERLETMLELPLFQRIRRYRTHTLHKIKAIEGDVLQDDFGLSRPDIETLSKEVSIVFHFAATLRLEAPLRDNVDMNTCGTLRAINLAKQFHDLDLFIHLSTAFCYPDYTVLLERTFPPSIKPQNVINILKCLGDKELNMLTPFLLGPHPNCYTFSKRLAENIVEQAYPDVPVVIARPSIVCPSVSTPIAGWVDNLNGPVGVMLGAGKGVIRTMLCNGNLEAQVVPVDTAINAILAIGMIEGLKKEKDELVPVYNVNIGHQKPTNWEYVLNTAKEYGRSHPLDWPLWYPNGDITTNRKLHEFKRICFHLVPAYIIDAIMFLTLQKRFMVKIQNRISQGLELLQYFTMRPWNFVCNNFDSIESKLSKDEREIFVTNLTNIDRQLYMINCVEGGRVYCLKENPNNVTRNWWFHLFLYALDKGVKLSFLWMVFFWLIVPFFTDCIADIFQQEPVPILEFAE